MVGSGSDVGCGSDVGGGGSVGFSVGGGGGSVGFSVGGGGGSVGFSVGGGGGSVGFAVGGGGSVGFAVGGGGSVGWGVFVGGLGVLVGFGVLVGGMGVLVGGMGVRVGGTGVLVGGTGVLVAPGRLIGPLVATGAEVAGVLGGSGAPTTGDLVGATVAPGTDLVGAGIAVADGLGVAGCLFSFLSRLLSLLSFVAVGFAPAVAAVDGALVLSLAPATATGALVVVTVAEEPPVAAGLALGSAVDSAASSAPLTNGTGEAGMNSVAVGGSAAASAAAVGSSISWLASPDCSAFGSNPGSKNEFPDDPEEPVKPRSGEYGPAAKFVILGESSSNSPSVSNIAPRQTLTIIPMRRLGRTACSSL